MLLGLGEAGWCSRSENRCMESVHGWSEELWIKILHRSGGPQATFGKIVVPSLCPYAGYVVAAIFCECTSAVCFVAICANTSCIVNFGDVGVLVYTGVKVHYWILLHMYKSWFYVMCICSYIVLVSSHNVGMVPWSTYFKRKVCHHM